MKKLFYLLFISLLSFGSCTKQEPIDVNVNVTQDTLYVNVTDSINCNCSSNGTGSLLIDTNLTGHWKQTNVNSPAISYWNNGQIDLHFFADGTWDISGVTGLLTFNLSPTNQGTYKIHSNNCIDLGDRVFNYSINNGVLTFSPVPGQDYLWLMRHVGDIIILPSIQQPDDYAEINNLVKQ